MNSREARIRAREVAIGLLNDLTTWIAAGSVVAVGVFSFVAAATIPGKASTSASGENSTGSSSPATSTSNSTSLIPRHHRDSSGISASSGPPMVATGSSR